jgi:hypothetical protein
MNLTRISILKIVLAIIFREVCEYSKETRVRKRNDIAMAHCRSFPGFEMMELQWRYHFSFLLSFHLNIREIRSLKQF